MLVGAVTVTLVPCCSHFKKVKNWFMLIVCVTEPIEIKLAFLIVSEKLTVTSNSLSYLICVGACEMIGLGRGLLKK